jgi:thiamine kinase-like enzyme
MKYLRFFLLLTLSFNLFGEELDRIYRFLEESSLIKTENVSIAPIDGGLTNLNYKVTLGEIPYFFRLGTEENLRLRTSLEDEYQATHLAASLAICPKIMGYSRKENLLVFEFIETSKSVDTRDPKMQKKICETLCLLHSLKVKLPKKLCPYDIIEHYRKNALDVGAVLPPLLEEIFPLVEQFKENTEWSEAACHNDLHQANFLDDGKKLWIIDWEYAALGDPFFDLATLVSTDQLSDSEAKDLLEIYLKRKASKRELKSFLFKSALADLRWGLWYSLQSKISPIEYDFTQGGESCLKNAFARLKRLKEEF